MMTALVLQLIHSVINCKPKEDQQKQSTDNTPNSADSVKETPVNEVIQTPSHQACYRNCSRTFCIICVVLAL